MAEEQKSFTMAERLTIKMDLTINQPLSFSQLFDLKKVKRQVKTLWQENLELYNYLEKVRMYALLIGKEKEWEEWKEANKFSTIDFQKPKKLFKTFKFRHCAFCQNPFSHGNIDRIYCGDRCKQLAFQQKKKRNKLKT